MRGPFSAPRPHHLTLYPSPRGWLQKVHLGRVATNLGTTGPLNNPHTGLVAPTRPGFPSAGEGLHMAPEGWHGGVCCLAALYSLGRGRGAVPLIRVLKEVQEHTQSPPTPGSVPQVSWTRDDPSRNGSLGQGERGRQRWGARGATPSWGASGQQVRPTRFKEGSKPPFSEHLSRGQEPDETAHGHVLSEVQPTTLNAQMREWAQRS